MDYWVGERCTTWWKRAVLLGRREVDDRCAAGLERNSWIFKYPNLYEARS